MKHLKKINEWFYLHFSEEERKIVDILEKLGIEFDYKRKFITKPKDGFEFIIKNDDVIEVETSYYGTFIKKEETTNLEKYLIDTLRENPDVPHKYNYNLKKR